MCSCSRLLYVYFTQSPVAVACLRRLCQSRRIRNRWRHPFVAAHSRHSHPFLLPHSAIANLLHQFNMSGFNPMFNQQQSGNVFQANQFNNQQQMSNLMPSTDQVRQQLQHLAQQQQQQQRAQLAWVGDASFQQQQVCSPLIIVSVPYTFIPTKQSSHFCPSIVPFLNSQICSNLASTLSPSFMNLRGAV